MIISRATPKASQIIETRAHDAGQASTGNISVSMPETPCSRYKRRSAASPGWCSHRNPNAKADLGCTNDG
jgi:hypothetical protein